MPEPTATRSKRPSTHTHHFDFSLVSGTSACAAIVVVVAALVVGRTGGTSTVTRCVVGVAALVGGAAVTTGAAVLGGAAVVGATVEGASVVGAAVVGGSVAALEAGGVAPPIVLRGVVVRSGLADEPRVVGLVEAPPFSGLPTVVDARDPLGRSARPCTARPARGAGGYQCKHDPPPPYQARLRSHPPIVGSRARVRHIHRG